MSHDTILQRLQERYRSEGKTRFRYMGLDYDVEPEVDKADLEEPESAGESAVDDD